MMNARPLIIINTKTFPIAVAGIVIPALSSLDFSEFSIDELIAEPNLAANLTIGDLIINDGTTNLSVADGTSYLTSFGSNQGVNNTIIGGDTIINNTVFFQDTFRNNEFLSIESVNLSWSDKHPKKNDWLNIGGAKHANSGHIMPFDGKIIRLAFWTQEVRKLGSLLLYINNVATPLITFSAVGLNKQLVDTSLDINFVKNDKLRLRMDNALETTDSVVDLGIKWRRA